MRARSAPAVSRRVQGLPQAAHLSRYHGGVVSVPPIFPVGGVRLGVEVDEGHALPVPCGFDREPDCDGCLAAAALLADNADCEHANS